MTEANKVFLKQFLITGGIFAVLMAMLDYHQHQEVSWLKFAIHFVLFGLVMGWLMRRNYLKNQREQSKDN